MKASDQRSTAACNTLYRCLLSLLTGSRPTAQLPITLSAAAYG